MKGLIAYFDVLGFSNLIREDKFSEKRKTYTQILDNAVKQNRNLDYIVFSDSVIIKSETINEKELLNLCKAISEISYELLFKLELPIRGCISCGEFTWDVEEGNSIISGIPILDAISWEKKQNWIGVILSPYVVDKFRDLYEKTNFESIYDDESFKIFESNIDWKVHIQIYNEIPLSSREYYEGFVVLPRNPESSNLELIFDLRNYRDKLRFMTLLAPDPSVQSKYAYSSNMLANIWVACEHRYDDYKQYKISIY